MDKFNKTIHELNKSFEMVIAFFGEPHREFLVKNFYIAGGCFASLLNGDSPKDYDFYARNKEAAIKIQSLCQDPNYILITDNALTIKIPEEGKERVFQFITFLSGEPEEVTKFFDFYHCMAWYDPIEQYMHIKKAKGFIISKSLKFNLESPYPVSALFRAMRFVERGFTINPIEIMSILQVLKLYDLFDKETLEEQVRGMYSSQPRAKQTMIDTLVDNAKLLKDLHSNKFKNSFKLTVNK